MSARKTVASALFFLALSPALPAAEADPLDESPSLLVTGKGNGPTFYKALLEAPLFVVTEGEASAGSALVFAHREDGGVKIIDVYTSEAQLKLGPDIPQGKPLRMQGRELFTPIRQTGCDIGLNAFSGHGGRFGAQKIQDLLKANP